MTAETPDPRDWPDGWFASTASTVRLREVLGDDAPAELLNRLASTKAATEVAFREGQVSALRDLAADLQDAGLGDEQGMAAFVRARADLIAGAS